MNTTLLFLKHLLPALEELQRELEYEQKKDQSKPFDPPREVRSGEQIKEPTTKPMGKSILSLGEASALLGMSKSYLYRLTSERGIPYYKLGSRLLFDEQKVRSWMETHAVEPLSTGRPRRLRSRVVQEGH